MKSNYRIGNAEMKHFYMPGLLLNDVSLKWLHNSLVRINEESGANVVNKMLDKNLSMAGIRGHLKNTIISMQLIDDNPCAFLISPILSRYDGRPVVHAGLVVISKNPGFDLVTLMCAENYRFAYEKMGKFFATNITSTPSIIETLDIVVPKCWPSPGVSLKVPPKGYKEVVKILKDEYMDKYFLDPAKLEINYKRFTLTSNSQEMGFTTDFHKISRSFDFKYMLFCHAWINYEKEEDIIQVGEVDFYKYLRMIYTAYRLKGELKKAQRALKSQDQRQNNFGKEKKAA